MISLISTDCFIKSSWLLVVASALKILIITTFRYIIYIYIYIYIIIREFGPKPKPDIRWKVVNDIRIISGYSCHWGGRGLYLKRKILYVNNGEHLSNIYRDWLFHKPYLNANQNITHALTKTDTKKQANRNEENVKSCIIPVRHLDINVFQDVTFSHFNIEENNSEKILERYEWLPQMHRRRLYKKIDYLR